MKETNLEKYSLKQENPLQLIDLLDKADSESSLLQFITCAWKILEPGRDFSAGWHIEAICEHLEAVTNGQIKRLLINVPPGCMKSLTTEVFWPAWEWGPKNLSSMRYVSASYSEALTVRDNRRTRTLIQSPWYQRLWGSRFQLVSDQNAKMRFDTDKMGFKIATSVGGLGTGERGDRFIIDDPHNVKEAESDVVRNAALMWFTEVVPTRVNDPDKSAILVIMQRVHEQDISGHIVAEELGYDHLCLPMEFEPQKRCITSIGFKDPRTEENELIWPDRMSRKVVEQWKKEMGSYAVAGQFQQRPSPRGGGMFKREWFEVVDAVPAGKKKRCRGWDLAASETDKAAYTAGVKISKTEDGMFYIEDAIRFRGSPTKVDQMLLNTSSQDSVLTRISIPQDPGQAGKSQKKYLSTLLQGYDVRFSPETGDKETRALGLSAQAEAGNVKIVRGVWNHTYLDELCSFPSGTYKDQVDATTRAFSELIGHKTKNNKPAAPTQIALTE